jgi:hypothetical protein
MGHGVFIRSVPQSAAIIFIVVALIVGLCLFRAVKKP